MSGARARRFVRALIKGQTAKQCPDGLFRIVTPSGTASLEVPTVQRLISDGLLVATKEGCRATPLCAKWLRRNLSATGEPANQHRQLQKKANGPVLNLCESPLARLASPVNGAIPFLAPHQVQAGEKIRRLFDRARMMERTTMSYDPDRLPSRAGAATGGVDLSDAAIDARRELQTVLAKLPTDCAGVVIDVCGYLKGLQLIETERRWPRRSAKLLLRVGLEQLAAQFGFSEVATGRATQKNSVWLDEGARPVKFEQAQSDQEQG